MSITIYNSLSRRPELLSPRTNQRINMFVCGPTVYDYIHIGNARVFVFFDVVAKYLAHTGFTVDYVQNITDIDDKIIKRAQEHGVDPFTYAQDYTEKFKADMKALGVTTPRYIPATERIEEVKKQVKTLIAKGHAYLIEGDGWYFDLSTFKAYGKLSGRTAHMADDAISRIDENEKKRNTGDFCVWKVSKDNEPSWPDDQLGSGRPGWHIEDTAITESEFGPHYDIHGGGQDLMFPHHEAEIAQQESATGDGEDFVKYWMHVAFLVNNEAKMSKSAGNFATVHELLKTYPKEVLRFYLLSNHYRTPLQYSEKIIQQAQAGAARLSQFRNMLERVTTRGDAHLDVAPTEHLFFEALNNDFNATEAIGHIFSLIKQSNPLAAGGNLSSQTVETLASLLDTVQAVLGIIPEQYEAPPQEVQDLIDQREQFRQDKNFAESDKLRAQINDLGWDIEDTVYGSVALKRPAR